MTTLSGRALPLSVAALLVGLVLVGVVLVVDLAEAARSWPVPLLAPLDWTGHLATSALALLAGSRCGVAPRRADVLTVLVASVALDVDHAPLYLGVPHVAGAGGRPLTHSLLTVAVLLAAAWLTTRRRLLLGVAAGVVLHLLRDVATGGGLPLLWPVDVAVRAPYLAYAAVLVGLALLAGVGSRAVRPRAV